jgi:hypothetical protein
LNHLGLLKHVRYIGGVRGGSWATLSYTYHQKEGISDEVFLGPIIPPNEISKERLKDMDHDCGRRVTSKDSLAVCTDLSGVLSGEVDNIAEQWAHITYKLYLHSVGIPEDKLIAWNSDYVQQTLQRNPDLPSFSILLPL